MTAHEPRELVWRGALEGRVEPALQTDGRDDARLRARSPRGLRHPGREDLDRIGRLKESPEEALVELPGEPRLGGAGASPGPADATGEEGVSRQDEAGCRAARSVRHEDREAVGGMSRRAQDADPDRTHVVLFPVLEVRVGKRDIGGLVEQDRGPGDAGEAVSPRGVVTVRMCREDVGDVDACLRRSAEGECDVRLRIDHRGPADSLASNEITRAAGLCCHEPPEDHRPSPSGPRLMSPA